MFKIKHKTLLVLVVLVLVTWMGIICVAAENNLKDIFGPDLDKELMVIRVNTVSESSIFDIPFLKWETQNMALHFADEKSNQDGYKRYLGDLYAFYQPLETYIKWYDNAGNQDYSNIKLLFNDDLFNEYWLEKSSGKPIDEKYVFELGVIGTGACVIVVSSGEYYYIPFLRNGEMYGEIENRKIYTFKEFGRLLDYQPVNITVNGNDLECTVPAFISYGQVFAPIRELLNAIGYEVLWDAETNLINFYHEDDGPYYKINYIKPSYYITEVENIDFTVFEGNVRYHGDILNEIEKKLVNLRIYQGKTMIAMEGYFTDDFLAILGYDCIIDKDDNHIYINAIYSDNN